MENLSTACQLVWVVAASEAANLNHEFIEVEHVFIALCKIRDLPLAELMAKLRMDPEKYLAEAKAEIQPLSDIFTDLDLDPVHLRRALRGRMGMGKVEYSRQVMHRSDACKQLFREASKICQAREGSSVGLLDLFLAIVTDSENKVCEFLRAEGVDLKQLQSAIQNAGTGEGGRLAREDLSGERKASRTPLLDKYGRDLTQLAREGKLSPVIGRREEITKIAQILCQKRKNNPILVGDAGVGKTCVVEGLGQRIVSPGVVPALENKRIVEINMSSVVAGTKYRGEFEERLQQMLNEAKNDGNVIIFIDEIHTIVSAGGGGESMNAANILKPALSRGDIDCIGATTTQEYRKYIEKDTALARRFQMVWIDEPTRDEAIEIMKGLRASFEAHHKVKITDEALEAAVELSMRYLNDFRLPDKAIDLIDQACVQNKLKTLTFESPPAGESAEERVQDLPEIGYDDIARVVSERCHVSLERLTAAEGERLRHIEEELGKRVMGQDHAIREICKAVRAAKAGLEDPRKPLGVFLFLGSTGVGKTELAKALTEFLFGDENSLLRFDMSEYMEKHTVSRLIGAPPGYIGYDEEGQLTSRVRTNPYSVVLFDEIEKAHTDVTNIFLQIFDEGRLTDSQGRRADFRNTIIIMTSNLGTSGVARQKPRIGIKVSESRTKAGSKRSGGIDREQYEQNIQKAAKSALSPELLNRIRKVIVFYPLSREITRKIIDKLLNSIRKRLTKKDMTLEVEEAVYDLLMEKGYSEIYGAREMERTVEDLISAPLASGILDNQFLTGQTILAKAQDGTIIFENKEV